MNFKRSIISGMIAAMLIILLSCSAATPKDAVNKLFDALKEYDIEKMETLLTEFPNAEDCPVTYNPFSDKTYVLLYQEAYKDLSHQVISVTNTTETTATIRLTVKQPDLKTAYSTALYTSMAMIFSNEDLFNEIIQDEDAEISNYVPNEMRNQAQQGKIETIETEYTLQLRKGENGWQIVTDEQLKNLVSSNLYQIASGQENIFGAETEEK